MSEQNEIKLQTAAERNEEENEILQAQIPDVSGTFAFSDMNDAEKRREKKEFLSDWSAMQTAMHRNVYQEATVAGVEEIPGYDEVFLVFFLKDKYRCLMPFGEIYRSDYGIDIETSKDAPKTGRNSLISRKRQMARKFIDVKIPFCITNMELTDPDYPEDHIIFTSRRKANAILERINYEPRANGQALIQEGSVQVGTIVNLDTHGMLINVGGVDTLMPVWDITHRYVFNLYKEYRTGEQIKVVVRKIEKDPEIGYKISVSAREVELIEAKKNIHKLPKNKKAEANMTVTNTYMNSKNDILFNGWLENYNMPAVALFAPTMAINDPIKPGRVIRVRIQQQGRDGKIQCVVTRIEDISSPKF